MSLCLGGSLWLWLWRATFSQFFSASMTEKNATSSLNLKGIYSDIVADIAIFKQKRLDLDIYPVDPSSFTGLSVVE